MKLAGKLGKIYGTQSLTGKILISNNLGAESREHSPGSVAVRAAHRHGLDHDRLNRFSSARSDVTMRICKSPAKLRVKIKQWPMLESPRMATPVYTIFGAHSVGCCDRAAARYCGLGNCIKDFSCRSPEIASRAEGRIEFRESILPTPVDAVPARPRCLQWRNRLSRRRGVRRDCP
jgi:hypothetical protein